MQQKQSVQLTGKSSPTNNTIVPDMTSVLGTVVQFVEETQKKDDSYLKDMRSGVKGSFRKPDKSDIARQTTSQNLENILRKNNLERVQKALCVIREIREGWDGTCLQCGAKIPFGRIEEHFALLCIECLQEVERIEKMKASRR